MLRETRLRIGAVFFLAVSQIVLSHEFWVSDTSWVSVELSQERNRKLDPNLFTAMSVGQFASAIDWLWMTILTDPHMSKASTRTHPQLYYDLDLLTDLDGAFSDVYAVGANLLAVIRNDGIGARDLLLKGRAFLQEKLKQYPEGFKEKFWSRAWDIYVLLGYVYLFELNDMPHAAEGFREAAKDPEAPAYLSKLAARLEQPGGEYEVGLRMLDFLISGAKDEVVRVELQNKRSNLMVSYYLYRLNNSKKQERLPLMDPWGGKVFRDQRGRAATTTPHESVFGLE